MEEEIWKDIPGYEGLYQASNLGNIKSSSHLVNDTLKRSRLMKEKILKPATNQSGYHHVVLSRNKEKKTYKVHRLVLLAFTDILNSNEKQVNHKDLNPLNNKIKNLEWVTNRENSSHNKKGLLGVSFCKKYEKYYSCIRVLGKSKNLGYYETEEEAHETYLKALEEYGLTNKYADKSQDNS